MISLDFEKNVSEKKTSVDYDALPEGAPYQLIDGELVMSPAPLMVHQIVAQRLFIKMADFIEKKKVGEVYFAPVDVRLDKENTFQPDILFISKDRKNILSKYRVEGAPDLVVEILSPSNAYYDLKKKKRIYEKFGVKEYWIIDAQEKSIEIFENKKGEFVQFGYAEIKGKIKSQLLNGFEIQLQDIFK